ncbi:MAG: hypothetical protein HZB46_02835 [Solirubrobacterales bacterium]|nr:hypothetical protein [Solirubrobacterales bacterium]
MSRAARHAVLALAAAGLAAAPAAQAGPPAMRLGVSDTATIQKDPTQRPAALANLVAARGTTLRIMQRWREIARQAPPDAATARDPGWAGYSWSSLDALVRDTLAAGVVPVVTILDAPSWAEGEGRPAVSPAAPAGTWRPRPEAFGAFMAAAATRYSGRYPDPANLGAVLPRVRFWQLWNEPNLPNFISPQWRQTGPRKFAPESPGIFKALLNAGYDGVKGVQPDATVIMAGTAPYGEPWPGGTRMPAARFVRELLCVDGRARPKARNCRKDPAKFDVLAHHPYPIGPPGRHAINPDDVVIPDFAKLTKPLAVAVKAGNVFPRKRKPVWATEISWDSNPPDPGGIEITQQARYLAGAIYVLWRQGVSAMIWWNLRDAPRGRGYQYDLQSGLYLRGSTPQQDTPKPAVTAFRFPFVAYRAYSNFRGHGAAKLWGMAPRASRRVKIQRFSGGRWRAIKTVTADARHVFELRVAAGRGARLRAVQDGEASIDAKVF